MASAGIEELSRGVTELNGRLVRGEIDPLRVVFSPRFDAWEDHFSKRREVKVIAPAILSKMTLSLSGGFGLGETSDRDSGGKYWEIEGTIGQGQLFVGEVGLFGDIQTPEENTLVDTGYRSDIIVAQILGRANAGRRPWDCFVPFSMPTSDVSRQIPALFTLA